MFLNGMVGLVWLVVSGMSCLFLFLVSMMISIFGFCECVGMVGI